jgi:hypothetical protein
VAPVLSVAAVVSGGGEPRHAPRRERAIGALVTIGGATTRPDYPPSPTLPPMPPRDDASTDGLLAQVEDALVEEIARAQVSGAPPAGLRPLRGRLFEVRAARERLRLIETVERYQASGPTAGAPDATMGRAGLRRGAQPLRFVSPGLLGLLVNVVA